MKTFSNCLRQPAPFLRPRLSISRLWKWILPGLLLLGFRPASAELQPTDRMAAPRIDGRLTWNEWPLASTIQFKEGTMTVFNDNSKLYLLLNVLNQTKTDPNDYFWVSIDVDRDGKITPGVDVNYALSQESRNLLLQSYRGPGEWELLNGNPRSSRGFDFDSFLADGSTIVGGPGEIQRHPHRTWELAIDLAEIKAKPGEIVRLGFRVAAPAHDLIADVPDRFYQDFRSLLEIRLDRPLIPVPTGDPDAIITIDGNPVEITQAIQTRDNRLPVVSGKRTMARVYIHVFGATTNQPLWVYLEGRRGGATLPGSPLVRLSYIPTTYYRSNLADTANFIRPDSWTDGTARFTVRVRDTFETVYVSSATDVTFTRKAPPVIWIVPVNSGSAGAPVTVSNTEIQAQRSYMETVYPVAEVDFVQRPWDALGANITVANTITELNLYHSQVVLAWVLGFLFIGDAPFDLPDQIYGMTTSAGGSSDPVWIGANDWVARGWRARPSKAPWRMRSITTWTAIPAAPGGATPSSAAARPAPIPAGPTPAMTFRKLGSTRASAATSWSRIPSLISCPSANRETCRPSGSRPIAGPITSTPCPTPGPPSPRAPEPPPSMARSSQYSMSPELSKSREPASSTPRSCNPVWCPGKFSPVITVSS